MNKNVLVTGGAGYVGSHVAKALTRSGFIPITYDNLFRGFESAVKWGPLVKGDLHNRDLLRKTLVTYQPVGVIHLAGLTFVHESVDDPLFYYRTNVGGSECLLTSMVQASVPCIVFSSTCSVYGNNYSEAIDESHTPQPTNPYAQSKWIVEQMLTAAGPAHDIKSTCLRYFNAAGADPDGEIGENHDPEFHLIPIILQVAAGIRGHVEIFGEDYDTEDGTAIRDYVHVSDLADAHVTALKRLLDGGSPVTLNLGAERGNSVRQVINAARKVTGHKIPAEVRPRRPGDPSRLVSNSSLARDILKWVPHRSDLEDQISDAWLWISRGNFDAVKKDK